MGRVLSAPLFPWPLHCLELGGGGFKTPPGKKWCLGLSGHSLGEGRELLRGGQRGPEVNQRTERINTGQC